MYQVDLLSVLRGISKNLEKVPDNPYVECAKNQLDEVIDGLTPKATMATENTSIPQEDSGDPGVEYIRRELLGDE